MEKLKQSDGAPPPKEEPKLTVVSAPVLVTPEATPPTVAPVSIVVAASSSHPKLQASTPVLVAAVRLFSISRPRKINFRRSSRL